mgnify:CR=1 FL=1
MRRCYKLGRRIYIYDTATSLRYVWEQDAFWESRWYGAMRDGDFPPVTNMVPDTCALLVARGLPA